MKNKSKKILTLILSAIMLVSVGCSKTKTSGDKTGNKETVENSTKVITDTLGNKVEIKTDIKRVIALPWPWPSAICAIDQSSERLVGIPKGAKESYENCILKKIYPKLAEVPTEYVDNSGVLNIEEVQKIKPDVAFMYESQGEQAEQLKTIGIPTVMLKYGTIQDFKDSIKVIGEVLDKNEQATKIIKYTEDTEAYFESKKSEIQSAKAPKILYIRDGELSVASKKNVNTSIMVTTGGENVAKDTEGASWAPVSMEQVLQWNPEMIYISNFSDVTPKDLYENTLKGQDWSNISAVKNKKVYKTPMGIYRWDAPSVEEPLMMRWMAKMQLPEVFKEYDIEEEITNFYKDILNYNLTEEELNEILNSDLNR